MINKMNELKKKMADLKDQMKKEAKIVFKEEAASIFEKYPDVREFSWTQYTPYFCDGDPCTFSANTDYPKINSLDEYEPESSVFKPAFKEIKDLLNSIGEEILEDMFGDHCEVVASRESVRVDEYQHD